MTDNIIRYTIKGFPLIRFNTRDVIDITRKGSIRFTSLKIYREMYKDKDDEVIGDPCEGRIYIHRGAFVTNLSGEVSQLIDCTIPTINENDFVLCMFGIKPNEQHYIRFSEAQIKQLADRYDTAMIITDVDELWRRIYKAATDIHLSVKGKFVNYYDNEHDDMGKFVDLLCNGTENIVFYKRKMYSYQQEFRFTIPNNTEAAYLVLNVGDITDITEAIATKDIINSEIIKII